MTKPMEGSKLYPTAVMLTMTGGFLDSYTYFNRGKVFANAQTGNIARMGLNLAQGNILLTLRYLKLLPWDGVAAAMHYERRYIYKLHNNALAAFGRAIEAAGNN